MFYFFTRARVVVCSARAPFFLSQILTSIETLFAFFCALRFFNLSIVTYPSVLRWKTRASCGRKALKKLEALENARKKRRSFFFFFLSLDCSLRDVTAAVFVLVFSVLRTSSLSRLSLNFSSLSKESRRRTCPTQEPPPLQKRCLFSL